MGVRGNMYTGISWDMTHNSWETYQLKLGYGHIYDHTTHKHPQTILYLDDCGFDSGLPQPIVGTYFSDN